MSHVNIKGSCACCDCRARSSISMVYGMSFILKLGDSNAHATEMLPLRCDYIAFSHRLLRKSSNIVLRIFFPCPSGQNDLVATDPELIRRKFVRESFIKAQSSPVRSYASCKSENHQSIHIASNLPSTLPTLPHPLPKRLNPPNHPPTNSTLHPLLINLLNSVLCGPKRRSVLQRPAKPYLTTRLSRARSPSPLHAICFVVAEALACLRRHGGRFLVRRSKRPLVAEVVPVW